MDYLFWQTNSIEDLELDKDLYPCIIWYLWKTRNDKLLRGIDKDPPELIKYAEGEYQAWFITNDPTTSLMQTPISTSQAICLENIYLVDGSWTSTSIFSGCGWMLLDNTGHTQLMWIRNQNRRESL